MSHNKLAISDTTFKSNVSKWLNIVRFNESGIVINYVGDHFYTIPQLFSSKKLLRELLGKYHHRYLFLYFELTSTSTIEDLRAQLVKLALNNEIKIHQNDSIEQLIETIIKAGYEVVFFLSRIERFFIEKSDLLSKLEFLSRNSRLSVLYFSELNLTNPQFFDQQREYSSMFQNIIYQKIYSKKDASEFVAYNENLWGITLPPTLKTQIIKSCGGNLWLLRQAVRLYRNNPEYSSDQILNSSELLTKALASWNQLFPNEQEVVEELIFKKEKSIRNVAALDYLFRIGLLEKVGLNYQLAIPLLEVVSQKTQTKEGFYLELGNIFYNGQNLSNLLTFKEDQLLRFLIKNNRVLVKREKIGEVVWNKSEVSIWALEKIVSKLRKKLISVGLPKDILITKKGVGYVFSG